MSWIKLLKYGLPVLLLIGVVTIGYFAVQKYNSTLEKNVELEQTIKDRDATITALEDAQQGISEAVDQGSTQTTQIIENTRVIEREIYALPKTQDCVNAPSVGYALGVLGRGREQTPSPDQLP